MDRPESRTGPRFGPQFAEHEQDRDWLAQAVQDSGRAGPEARSVDALVKAVVGLGIELRKLNTEIASVDNRLASIEMGLKSIEMAGKK